MKVEVSVLAQEGDNAALEGIWNRFGDEVNVACAGLKSGLDGVVPEGACGFLSFGFFGFGSCFGVGGRGGFFGLGRVDGVEEEEFFAEGLLDAEGGALFGGGLLVGREGVGAGTVLVVEFELFVGRGEDVFVVKVMPAPGR